MLKSRTAGNNGYCVITCSCITVCDLLSSIAVHVSMIKLLIPYTEPYFKCCCACINAGHIMWYLAQPEKSEVSDLHASPIGGRSVEVSE